MSMRLVPEIQIARWPTQNVPVVHVNVLEQLITNRVQLCAHRVSKQLLMIIKSVAKSHDIV